MTAAVWLVWALAGAAVTLSARHPLYTLLMLAIALISRETTPGDRRALSPWLLLTLPLFGAVFNALNAHVGDTVLLRLPEALPLIGGPITVSTRASWPSGTKDAAWPPPEPRRVGLPIPAPDISAPPPIVASPDDDMPLRV